MNNTLGNIVDYINCPKSMELINEIIRTHQNAPSKTVALFITRVVLPCVIQRLPLSQALVDALVHLPPHGGLLIGGPGNGAPPPSKSSPYAIIYDPRAEMKHIPKVYDAAPLNDRLKELIRAVIFVSINHGSFAKLGRLQGFHFFTSIH